VRPGCPERRANNCLGSNPLIQITHGDSLALLRLISFEKLILTQW